jgi:hypothetical protein
MDVLPGEEEEAKEPCTNAHFYMSCAKFYHDVSPGGSNRERESSSRGGTTELPSQYLKKKFTIT